MKTNKQKTYFSTISVHIKKKKICGVTYPWPASKEMNGQDPITHLFLTTRMIQCLSKHHETFALLLIFISSATEENVE